MVLFPIRPDSYRFLNTRSAKAGNILQHVQRYSCRGP